MFTVELNAGVLGWVGLNTASRHLGMTEELARLGAREDIAAGQLKFAAEFLARLANDNVD